MSINTKKMLQSKFQIILWLLILPLLTFQTKVSAATLTNAITLTQRQMCDLELLLNGGFAPLEGFMDRKTYESVCNDMHLPDGSIWPMPIVLDVSEKVMQKIIGHDTLTLCDPEETIIAYLQVSEIWKPNRLEEVKKVYGTTDTMHPGVAYVLEKTGDYYIGGKVTKVTMPKHYDFTSMRRTPAELKAYFKERGIKKIVGFQTRNPMHRAHVELTTRAAASVGAHLLLHPVVGMTKPGDVDYFTRVKCYKNLLPYYPEDSVTLSLLPISMRMAGPREAIWHAIIRRNYGCTHFIVGRDHAGPGKDSSGKDFYGPYEAQEMAKAHAAEIGITIVPFKEMVYVKEDMNYQPVDEVAPGKTVLNISGTQLRKMLREGLDVPAWFTYPEVIAELKKVFPPRPEQGFTLFFTGLPSSGKSTIANALSAKLMEIQDRPITLLDGDVLRAHLSSELGFSKEHRSINVRRVGYVASEITKNGGAVLCALIAPYAVDRQYNRSMISSNGNYIEIYVSTPQSECESRDPKGMYAKAREGKITGFTGIDDPYEVPKNPELVIDASQMSVSEAVDLIISYLISERYLKP